MSSVTVSGLAAFPLLRGMREDHIAVLSQAAEEVSIPAGHRLFEDGGTAKKFWLIEAGRVNLDVHIPGEGPIVLGSLGIGDLLGWSWLFPPYKWAFGAVAVTEVRAFEFDAETVRTRCEADSEFGRDLTHHVAQVLARRLLTTRMKLLSCQSGRNS